MLFSVFLIVFLTLLNALFAMSEMALSGCKKTRLTTLYQTGGKHAKGAQAALCLMAQPTHFLSTVQVGITSIGMLNGIVGEAAFSQGLTHQLQHWGLATATASMAATTIVVVCITFFTLIFGELVPKRIGQLHPETVAINMSRPMTMVAKIASPFVQLLSNCTQAVLQLLQLNNNQVQNVTEEEIHASLEEGVDAGLIEDYEHHMLRNVFHLDDRPLTSLMVPRNQVVWLDAKWSANQALTHIKNSYQKGEPLHAHYPVCHGNLTRVAGIVATEALLFMPTDADDSQMAIEQTIQHHITPVAFIPETLTGMELLAQFRKQSQHMVMVVDEYGEVQGLLTAHDILEAITGQLRPTQALDAWATQQTDGSWRLNGLMPLGELRECLDIKQLPNEGKGHYNTLAGLCMMASGRLPEVGEEIQCEGWKFKVLELQGKRVSMVLASPIQNQSTEAIDPNQ